MSQARQSARRHAPSAERNSGPILEVLRRVLPPRGAVLEIASGTGQHVVRLATALPGLIWQPTERDPEMLDSIAAWAAEADAGNIRAPFPLDVTAPDWDREPAVAGLADGLVAVVNVNMIHISPWAACEGLMRGAGNLLPASGILYLYGPFKQGGRHTAPSNVRFDASLRARDPAWGVRDLDEVAVLAEAEGLVLGDIVEMPANNLSVIFRRAG